MATPDLVAPDNRIASGADLDTAVQVVEDVIVLEPAVAVVVKVYAHLLARVDAVTTQYRGRSWFKAKTKSVSHDRN